MLRPAIIEDAEAIGSIRVSAWRAAYQQFMPSNCLAELDPLHNLGALRERLAAPKKKLWFTCAEVNGAVVGFSMVGAPRYETLEGHAELWSLNVLPSHWRTGIARGLTLKAIGETTSAGYCVLELWCIIGNLPARAAYESVGFSLTGKERTSSHLTGHPLHEVLYAKAL